MFWSLNLLKVNNIIDLIKNDTLATQKKNCTNDNDVCGFGIIWSVSKSGFKFPDSIWSDCVRKKYLFIENQPNWNKYYLDYDSKKDIFWIDDFCNSSLCNSFDLKNLPLAKKVLSTVIKGPKHHDALCPGYSDNHTRIIMHKSYQYINVPEGSNLLLLVNKAILIYERHRRQPVSSYNETKWTFSSLENNHNDSMITLFRINKDGNVTKYKDQQDLINNNKIFYYSVVSMHICNFTKEDEGIFKHIDIFNKKANLVYAINITTKEVEKSALSTSRIKTTILPTQMEIFNTNIKLANQTKKDNTIKHIIIGITVPLGITSILLTYLLYKKCTKNKHQLLENENETIDYENIISTSV
jgi:hypothetical protein